MENLSPQVTYRIRIAQAITIALLMLVALIGHRVEMQSSVPPAVTLH